MMRIVGAVVLAFLAIIGFFTLCDNDNDGEILDEGWGQVELVAGGDDNRGGRNDNGRECDDTEDCSTFSPSFEDSPIIVCVQPEACRFG